MSKRRHISSRPEYFGTSRNVKIQHPRSHDYFQKLAFFFIFTTVKSPLSHNGHVRAPYKGHEGTKTPEMQICADASFGVCFNEIQITPRVGR
jgi:hypothetical protein